MVVKVIAVLMMVCLVAVAPPVTFAHGKEQPPKEQPPKEQPPKEKPPQTPTPRTSTEASGAGVEWQVVDPSGNAWRPYAYSTLADCEAARILLQRTASVKLACKERTTR
jgi:hypothetical protein